MTAPTKRATSDDAPIDLDHEGAAAWAEGYNTALDAAPDADAGRVAIYTLTIQGWRPEYYASKAERDLNAKLMVEDGQSVITAEFEVESTAVGVARHLNGEFAQHTALKEPYRGQAGRVADAQSEGLEYKAACLTSAEREIDEQRARRAVAALRAPDHSLASVANTVRQSLAELIEEQAGRVAELERTLADCDKRLNEYAVRVVTLDREAGELEHRIERALADLDALMTKASVTGDLNIESGSGPMHLLSRARAILRGDADG